MVFKLNSRQVKALNEILSSAEDAEVRHINGVLEVVVKWVWVTEELRLYEDGSLSYGTSWGETYNWDRWYVSPSGEIEYTGNINEDRMPPSWLEKLDEVEWP